jgi:hypothetical protein
MNEKSWKIENRSSEVFSSQEFMSAVSSSRAQESEVE